MRGGADAVEQVLAATNRRRGDGLGRTRIAVDGRDAAGKTTFADQLATGLVESGIETYRASIDDWQHPPEIRYRRGRFSSEGYYLDGFDFEGMKHRLLEPFAAGAGFELRAYDVEEERKVADDLVVARVGSVLIVDGVFLLRAELYACWELKVYVRVNRATSIDRGVARDEVRSGDAILERRLYDERYAPAQDRYLEAASPEARADVVIDNEYAKRPVIVDDTRRIATDPDHLAGMFPC